MKLIMILIILAMNGWFFSSQVWHDFNKPTPKPSPQAPPQTGQGEKVINISPVTAIGSQSTIDQGKLVTWMTSPTCLIAGHNNRGWQWLDDVANGTKVNVKTGPCVGSYRVYSHKWQNTKGGPVPSWMNDPQIGLILQTCTTSGLGFSILHKI